MKLECEVCQKNVAGLPTYRKAGTGKQMVCGPCIKGGIWIGNKPPAAVLVAPKYTREEILRKFVREA